MNQSPIIIIGMHRSGTSLTCKLLEQMGLFTGMRKDANHEALFFQRLNKYILASLGTSWDNPAPYHFLNNSEQLQSLLLRQLNIAMTNPSAISYFGIGLYLKKIIGFGEYPQHWGWKDPRNTLTLPLWLRLFPDAKVIHVTRHGVDVAQSLQARSMKELIKSEQRNTLQQHMIATGLFSESVYRLVGSARCLDIREGLKLWAEYMEIGRQNTMELGERCLTIKYEELLQQPKLILPAIADFCSLTCDTTTITALTTQLKAERAYAYQQQPELQQLAEQATELLSQHGY